MDRKTGEKNVRKLTRSGKVSLALILPRELVLELGWKDNQKVVVKKRGQGLLIEDWQKNG